MNADLVRYYIGVDMMRYLNVHRDVWQRHFDCGELGILYMATEEMRWDPRWIEAIPLPDEIELREE